MDNFNYQRSFLDKRQLLWRFAYHTDEGIATNVLADPFENY